VRKALRQRLDSDADRLLPAGPTAIRKVVGRKMMKTAPTTAANSNSPAESARNGERLFRPRSERSPVRSTCRRRTFLLRQATKDPVSHKSDDSMVTAARHTGARFGRWPLGPIVRPMVLRGSNGGTRPRTGRRIETGDGRRRAKKIERISRHMTAY